MVLPRCPTCGLPTVSRDGRCPRCVTQGTSETTGSGVEILRPLELDAPEQGGGAAADRTVEAAGADGLHVDIQTRLEYPSIPRTSDPIAHLLVDITPSLTPDASPNLAQSQRPDAGPAAHVILLLDLSASMNHPDKYPVLTEALSGMLQDLASPKSAEVLLSVVLFAYGSETLFRDVPASRLVPRQVLASIDASPLRFGRYTDAAGALRIAARIAADQLRSNRGMPTRVYLLTDGRPQDVPLTTENLKRLRTFAVDVDSLAFGADADVRLLQELVSGGRGGTVKLVRPDTLGDAFDRIGDVAQRIVGNRAIVEFELGRGVMPRGAFRYRPGRFKFGEDAFNGGSTFRTDLGALEAGRRYSLLFELRVPCSKADITDVGRISLQIRRADHLRTFASQVFVPRTSDASLPAPDADVVAARDVLAALSATDAESQARALRLRRDAYVLERRDPRVIAVLEKAIRALETDGSLAALTANECAALQSHTCTAGGARPPVSRKEFAAG